MNVTQFQWNFIMATEIWISFNFHVSWNIPLGSCFFQLFEKCRNHSQFTVIQKHYGWLNLALGPSFANLSFNFLSIWRSRVAFFFFFFWFSGSSEGLPQCLKQSRLLLTFGDWLEYVALSGVIFIFPVIYSSVSLY